MVDRSALYKGKPVKALTEGKHSAASQQTGAWSCVFAAAHSDYRIVDFKRTKSICRRPSSAWNTIRTHRLYCAGEIYRRTQAYILAPQRLAVGDTVIAGNYVDVKPGNVMPLGNMPIGTIIHNVD